MSDAAILAEGLGKKYVIGHVAESFPTMRDAIVQRAMGIARQTRNFVRGQPLVDGDSNEEFWALKDVSFSIRHGDVVGIIGRNGSGKSTLLKILSRVVEPTTGHADIRGRVASLLEVGTGFHPELSGRENIFLNGAIMGMSRADIRKRFDEIVSFAEAEQFLDTPVKRYSSGMYVRLAFAVAAHLEPDILIIDEVLAVGDAQFQKKCLGKMEEVSNKKGRTVLFVSHQMGMIASLCKRAMLFEGGNIIFDGSALDTVTKYHSRKGGAPFSVDYTKRQQKIGDEVVTLRHASLEDMSGNEVGEIDIFSPFKVKMAYSIDRTPPSPLFAFFHFYDSQGQCAFTSGGGYPLNPSIGIFEAACLVPGHLLNNDVYSIDLVLTYAKTGVHAGVHEKGALSIVVVAMAHVIIQCLMGRVDNNNR